MSNPLLENYKKLSGKYLHVSSREQLLILICGLVLVILLSYSLFLDPLMQKSEKLESSTLGVTKSAMKLEQEIALLTEKINQNPNVPVQARIEELNQQIQKITAQLNAKTSHLVPANKMANMLENLLSDNKGLGLIELKSIPPFSIVDKQLTQQESGLYRHGVALKFEGSYFDIQQYLEKLEASPWKFYWKKFDYAVNVYPKAVVEIEIYTLSTSQAFIGI